MSAEWKPGDVATLTLGGRTQHGPARYTAKGWRCLEDDYLHEFASVRDARPLVVIDPEDGEGVDRLAALIRLNGGGHPYATLTAEVASSEADAVQAALRSLVSLPKPKEPTGLGAVVEDSNGDKWVRLAPRVADFDWLNADDPNRSRAWRNVAAVRVLSEGVAS